MWQHSIYLRTDIVFDLVHSSQAECEMTVRAGRKGSSDVANWFKDKIGHGSATACSSIDSLPGKLNFAFVGKMEFDFGGNTLKGKDLVIAQGNNGRNNWWIGGPNMVQIAVQPGIAAAAAQTFHYKVFIPAKVTFFASFGCISNMQMGVIKF